MATPPFKELSGRIGKYDIIRPLGKGAMGMVYLAHDRALERDVALKVMVAHIADDPELKQRFQREARAVAKMTHPNVVTVFDLGELADGAPYIAMELLKGQDLQRALRQSIPLPLERRVAVIVQVLAGLAHAHQAGIVHRDIKPANIFLTADGAVKIMDFGVARLTNASLTGTGNVVGTADYMSPEQVKGAKVDGRSDLFSVGCLLFELLAGRRPFHSDNLMAIFYKITHEEADFTLIPEAPECQALLPIVRKAMAREVEDRYQTAYDFAVDLREYLKVHAASVSGPHAFQDLPELGPRPTSLPQPLTDAPLRTRVARQPPRAGSAVDVGATIAEPRFPTARRARASAEHGSAVGATLSEQSMGAMPTVVSAPGTGKTRPPSPTVTSGERTVVGQAPSSSPLLYGMVGAMGVALLVALGYIYLAQSPFTGKPASRETPSTESADTLAANQTTPDAPPAAAPAGPAPVATPEPPPATAAAAPIPSAPASVVGKAATALKAAQAAFTRGDYGRTLAEARNALREDPRNSEAQQLVENALSGQKSEKHFRAAEAALRESDFAQAIREAEAGRALAPWDTLGADLLSRAREAQQRAQQAEQQAQERAQQQVQQQRQQQLAAQVNTLLSQADAALAAQNYDAAIGLYDDVLKLDPQNQRATLGKTSAVGARAVAQAAAAGARAGASKSFVAGKTSAQSAETRASGNPEGFEPTPGVTVKRGSQAAALPGKITFDVDPEAVKAGDKYTVKIYFLNEGQAPIQIRELFVSTKINGRAASGPVPAQAKEVAPQQKALLLSLPDFWKEDTTSWSIEVTVRTAQGETYKNQLSWK